VDFTREPIVETVITPKEGCKVVVRSSKNAGQEEFFVDAVEVVSFGNAVFYRSLEKPKSFMVPVSDYELLEVREARMVLKHVGNDRSIKIGGGKEPTHKREHAERNDHEQTAVQPAQENAKEQPRTEAQRSDKKRDRRRNMRRRRGGQGDNAEGGEGNQDSDNQDDSMHIDLPAPNREAGEGPMNVPPILSSLLPPPQKLISETIAQYKELFKGSFFLKDTEKVQESIQETVKEEPKPVESKEETFVKHEEVSSTSEEKPEGQ